MVTIILMIAIFKSKEWCYFIKNTNTSNNNMCREKKKPMKRNFKPC